MSSVSERRETVSRLSDYLRKGSKFLRIEDVKDGDVAEIVSEVRVRPAEESKFKKQSFLVDVRLPGGEVKTWTMNMTTFKRLIEAYGDDVPPFRGWMGKKVRLTVQPVTVAGETRLAIFGFPVVGEAEAVKGLLADVRKIYPDRVEAEMLEKIMRTVRGLNISAEEAARLAGLKIVEEGGKKFVCFK
jgi:hypothetical protein